MPQVKDLAITHKKDLTTLVSGLSFVLSPGDRVYMDARSAAFSAGKTVPRPDLPALAAEDREPTRDFSPTSAPVIRRALADFPGAIISVSHDRLYLNEVCARVLADGSREA